MTTSTCATGYTAKEQGYIKLGSSPDADTVNSTNTRNLNHSHGFTQLNNHSTLSLNSDSHSHSAGSIHGRLTASGGLIKIKETNSGVSSWSSNWHFTPSASTSGSSSGLSYGLQTAGTSGSDSHSHSFSTNISSHSGGGVQDNTDQSSINIEPENIIMRLCIKS